MRKLKIYTKYEKRSYDYITIPEIRLQGKWLKEMGFKQGDYVKIEQKGKRLILSVDKNTQDNKK